MISTIPNTSNRQNLT